MFDPIFLPLFLIFEGILFGQKGTAYCAQGRWDLVAFSIHCQSCGLPRSGQSLVVAVWQLYLSFLNKYPLIHTVWFPTYFTYSLIHSFDTFICGVVGSGRRRDHSVASREKEERRYRYRFDFVWLLTISKIKYDLNRKATTAITGNMKNLKKLVWKELPKCFKDE